MVLLHDLENRIVAQWDSGENQLFDFTWAVAIYIIIIKMWNIVRFSC